jgi:hypothetical protein
MRFEWIGKVRLSFVVSVSYLGHEVVVGVNRGELREEGEGVHLLHNESQNSKHGKAAMLELGLTQNAEIEHVGEPLEKHRAC